MRRMIALATVLVGLALTAGCGGSQEGDASRMDKAKALISSQPVVSGQPLSACLDKAGFRLDDSYRGVQDTVQMVYGNTEGSFFTINVDLTHRIVAPWQDRDEYKLRLNGCTLSDVGPGTPAS